MKFVKIDPFKQPETVEAISLVYQQSFGGEPWDEGYLCPVCKKVFALIPSIKICSSCAEQLRNVLVVEYWPTSKIIRDFYREMMNPDSICVIVQSHEKVIGFVWGYRVSTNPDLDKHLDALNLHQSLYGNFFYLDECAIMPSCQGRGIGKLLVNYVLREQQQKQVLLRTMDKSRMYNLIKNIGGEIVQRISHGRIIMKLFTS